MTTTILIRSPEALEETGLQPLPPRTLESDPGFVTGKKALERWARRLRGLHTPRDPEGKPKGSGGTPPRPHQLRHAAIAMLRQHNFWAWSMGVGKTGATALVILGQYGEQLFPGVDWEAISRLDEDGYAGFLKASANHHNLPPGAIQISVPRHLMNQTWMRELRRMDLAQFAEVIESEIQMKKSRAPIWIYEHDLPKAQSADGEKLRKAKRGWRLSAKGKPYFWGKPMGKVMAKQFPPGILAIDEVHRFRPGTARTKAMDLVIPTAKRLLTLTGTPMDGWVRHAAVIFGLTYGESTPAYPYTNAEFAKRFTNKEVVDIDIATGGKTVGKERPIAGINHMQIPAFIHSTWHLMHRLTLADPEVHAHVPYPDVIVHEIPLTMDPEHEAFYRKLHEDHAKAAKASLESGMARFKLRPNMLKLINNLRMALHAPESLGYTGPQTMETAEVIKIVKRHMAEGRKGLIGTTFVEESRTIHEALQAAGIKGIRIYAEDAGCSKKKMTPDEREELIEQFMDDPEQMYLICVKDLVADGLNLAETASYTISCSHGWRSNIELQWLARVARPGQAWTHVDAYTLLYVRSIAVYIFKMLQAKIKATAGIIDQEFTSKQVAAATIDTLDLAGQLANEDTAHAA